MTQQVLIAGGYGLIGSQIAQALRALSPDREIVLAGRRPEQAAPLLERLGNARSLYLDQREMSLEALKGSDLVISSMHDPGERLYHAANTLGIPYVNITLTAQDIAPLLLQQLHGKMAIPVVLVGQSDGGSNLVIALQLAQDYKKIKQIKITSLYDETDPLGPMNMADFSSESSLAHSALLQRQGQWEWINSEKGTETYTIDGQSYQATPMPLLDAPGLVAHTGAAEARWQYISGISRGRLAGQAASHDVYIDIVGTSHSGEARSQRFLISDPHGQAHQTGTAIALVAARLLHLRGEQALPSGISVPEVLLDGAQALTQLRAAGILIEKI